MAQCAANKGNECRNLHSFIHRNGKTLAVQVSTAPAKVMVLRGKPRVESVQFPVLYLSSWATRIFADSAQILLGGHTLDNPSGFRGMFLEFWQRYRWVRPNLDIYKEDGADLSLRIPIGLHGDEGRGKLRRPLMVLSYQPMISYKGPGYSNASGFLGAYRRCPEPHAPTVYKLHPTP